MFKTQKRLLCKRKKSESSPVVHTLNAYKKKLTTTLPSSYSFFFASLCILKNDHNVSGVRLPHSIILNRLQWQWRTFPYSDSEKVGIFKTALTFVDSISEIWGPLLNGMRFLIFLRMAMDGLERDATCCENYFPNLF